MNASADHARFAEWDAAYVLGALPPADRSAYEEHLSACDACRAALAELAPLPGLLSHIPTDRALRMIGEDAGGATDSDAVPGRRRPGADAHAAPRPPDDDAEDDARPRTLRTSDGLRAELIDIGVVRGRRRRLAQWSAAALAAAAAVAAIVALPMWLTAPDRPGPERESITLAADADVPLEASVELTEVAWGTRIEMDCRYDGAGAPGGAAYALVVVGADGTASELSSWRAYGGTTAELSAGTALDLDEIASIEIRFPGGDAPLLSGTIPTG